MDYFYYIDYDPRQDSFWGAVVGPESYDAVYEIEDTDQMIDILECEEMDHIDDIKGLERMLKFEGVLDKGDKIKAVKLFFSDMQ